jgi:hypothetical protein
VAAATTKKDINRLAETSAVANLLLGDGTKSVAIVDVGRVG